MTDETETATKELIESINGTVKEYSGYIDSEPGLLSLLYDVDLLPVQLLHVLRVNPPAAEPNARRMIAICELWRRQRPANQASLEGGPMT